MSGGGKKVTPLGAKFWVNANPSTTFFGDPVADMTNSRLQSAVIYSAFIRNHTEEGTFAAFERDLDRIANLGCDIVWLQAIHPIGVKGRKGSLGSPYAIRDYRAVNPEFGTREDFEHLVAAAHERGLLVMMDVVYNHTSPDSVLWETHPEWFYTDANGEPGNKIGDWADVIDLDYTQSALWDYQIETLVEWARLVDGFRCDVASFVPVEFWKRARAAVEEVHPGFIWLAETVHRSFGETARRLGFYSATDTEDFEAFDIEYSYDVQTAFDDYLAGRIALSHYLDLIDFQEATYPANYNKLRYLENHDTPRIASVISQREGKPAFSLANLTALIYFLKGTTMIYQGQEVGTAERTPIFDHNPVNWGLCEDLTPLMRRLSEIQHTVLGDADFHRGWAMDETDTAVLVRDGSEGRAVAVLSLTGEPAEASLVEPMPEGPGEQVLADGDYVNLVDGETVHVRDGVLACAGAPVIVHVETRG